MPWDVSTELLAQLLEETSRLTRESPLQVDRPWSGAGSNGYRPTGPAHPSRSKAAAQQQPPPTEHSMSNQGIHSTDSGGVVANGMLAMIQLAASEGQTVRSGDSE